jgi:hypothetical protein
VRAIVQPNAEDERRFATVRRVSEANLGLYRTLLQPFVKAWANDQTVAWLNKMQATEWPYLLFSDKNPLTQEVARLAEQVRAERAPTSADNPFIQFQEAFSRQMVAALDAWRDFRDQSLEQLFLATYGNSVLQAMVGLRATDDSPRRRPGLEPEEINFIRDRLADLRTRIGEGGLREAVMRSLVYIGLAGPGIDERVFNVLNNIRGAHGDISLAQFKTLLREQFFALVLDQKAALAAIPAMLPKDADARKTAIVQIRAVVTASGTPEGTRAERLAEVEAMFAAA